MERYTRHSSIIFPAITATAAGRQPRHQDRDGTAFCIIFINILTSIILINILTSIILINILYTGINFINILTGINFINILTCIISINILTTIIFNNILTCIISIFIMAIKPSLPTSSWEHKKLPTIGTSRRKGFHRDRLDLNLRKVNQIFQI